jgi:hypothetical protein
LVAKRIYSDSKHLSMMFTHIQTLDLHDDHN